jgi:serine protease inhibitor
MRTVLLLALIACTGQPGNSPPDEVIETDLVETDTRETDLVDSDLVDSDLVDSDLVDSDLVDSDLVDSEPAPDTDTDPPDTASRYDLVPAVCADDPSDRTVPNPTARLTARGQPAIDALSADLGAFGLRLFRAAAEATPDNVFLGTHSIAGLLGSAALDARGDTRAALAQALAPGAGLDAWQAAYATYEADLQAPPADRAGFVQHVRKLFYAPGYAPQTPWSTLAAGQQLTTRALDFSDATAARDHINNWVSEQTLCLIPTLFPPSAITPSTDIVLVDAMVVTARWWQPFPGGGTLPFHLADGSTATVDAAQGVVSARVDVRDGYTLVQIPVRDATLAYTIVLPDEPTGLPHLLASIDADTVAGWLDPTSATEDAYELWVPILQLNHRPELIPLLDAIGLAPLTTAPALGSLCASCNTLDAAVHEARLITSLDGFTAAAASGGASSDTAPPPAPLLQVDRPHLVVIGDAVTRTPWFFGRVTDPRSP